VFWFALAIRSISDMNAELPFLCLCGSVVSGRKDDSLGLSSSDRRDQRNVHVRLLKAAVRIGIRITFYFMMSALYA